jgi:hypothetical protein
MFDLRNYNGQPLGTGIQSLPLTPDPGDSVETAAAYVSNVFGSGKRGYQGYVWNLRTGNYQPWSYPFDNSVPLSDFYFGDGGEIVDERPNTGDFSTPLKLSKFGSASSGGSDGILTFTAANINGFPVTSTQNPIPMWPIYTPGYPTGWPFMGQETSTPGAGPGSAPAGGGPLVVPSGVGVNGAFYDYWGGCFNGNGA